MSTTDVPLADSAQRATAIDPQRSIVVQAPAGSGKTALLVERVLNLLESVDAPEEILALTFTRKAAAEMRERILDRLGSNDERARAVRERGAALGWQLETQPARLRIQTIDAFCAGLVGHLPVTSGFPDGTAIVDAPEPLYENAIRRVFDEPGPFRNELVDVLSLHDGDYARVLGAFAPLLAKRDQWFELVATVLRAGEETEPNARYMVVDAAISSAVRRLHANAIGDVAALLPNSLAQRIARVASTRATALGRTWDHDGLPTEIEAWQFIADLVATREGTPRLRFGAAQGFVDGVRDADKLELRDVIDELTRGGALAPIAALRRLPALEAQSGRAASVVSVVTVLALATVQLEAAFRDARAADFAELVFAAHRALGGADAPTDLALALDYRIKHLLVDEFQDTSAVQHRLVARLMQEWQPGDGRTFFAVGDPMQSIYRFRDADVGLFQRTRRTGIGAIRPESVQLHSNFRSSAALVTWCNRAFAIALGSVEDPTLGQVAFAPSLATRPTRDGDGCRIRIIASEQDASREEAAMIANAIEEIRRGNPDDSLAILARTRAHLTDVLERLDASGIPWIGADVHPLAERPIVADMLSLLRALQSDDDLFAWFAILRAPFVGLTLRDLECLAQSGNVAHEVRDGACDHLLSADGLARIQRIRPVLNDAARDRGQVRARRWLESTFVRMGGLDAYDDAALAHGERLLDLIGARFPWRVESDELERAVARLFANPQPRRDAVVVMTIHRAKGLEFDHVVMPSLHRVGRLDDPPPILWRREGDHILVGVNRIGERDAVYRWLQYEANSREANESVRLLYVGATRARRSLHLSAVLAPDGASLRAPHARSLLAGIWSAVSDTVEVTHADAWRTDFRAVRSVHRVLPTDYSRTVP